VRLILVDGASIVTRSQIYIIDEKFFSFVDRNGISMRVPIGEVTEIHRI
jgi:hypothetical protein